MSTPARHKNRQHGQKKSFRRETDNRLSMPLMVVNLAQVPTRGSADKVLAHETMHLRVPSYGHKREAGAGLGRPSGPAEAGDR